MTTTERSRDQRLQAALEPRGSGRSGHPHIRQEQQRTLRTADGTVQQLSKYLHEWNFANFLVKALGGTLGAGLITRIVRGYTFISRNGLLRLDASSASAAARIRPARLPG